MRLLLPCAIWLAIAAPALAVASDGVNEINQTCAVLTGCFTGDGAGFPVTIGNSPGRSYRLTGDLVVPDANTTAVSVVASGVSLDLGGFEIRGPNLCVDFVCTFDGTGFGVQLTGDRARIFDGSITGMGSVGIYSPNFGSGHIVEEVRVAHNRYQGIRLDGYGNTVRGSVVIENGDDGVQITGFAATVIDNVIYGNAGNGMTLNASGSRIVGNSVSGNVGNGVRAGQGCMIQGNTMRTNGGYGLFLLDGASSFRENTISDNTGGSVLGFNASSNLGSNFCNGSQSCQ